VPILLAVAAGVAVAAAFAMLIGAAAFRLRGAYFAIGTLALGEILRTTFNNALPEISTLPAATIVAYRLSLRYYLALALAALSVIAVAALAGSPLGLGMQAIREDEDAAEATGVAALGLKLRALTLSTGLAGAAGGLFAYYHVSYYPVASVRTELDLRGPAHDLHRRRRHPARARAGRRPLRVPQGIPDGPLGGLPSLDLRRALHRHRAALPRRARAGCRGHAPVVHASTGEADMTTTRIPLLEIGSLQSRLPDLIAKKGELPWSEAVVLTDDIQAFLICHPPGQPNDTHYHHHDEWWIVLQGEIDWYIEGQAAPIHARAGDFVFGPKHLWHHLEPVGHEPSIRVAINARGEFHRYDRPGCKPL
jgi:quercetin dioxygenase-like cupin family protein